MLAADLFGTYKLLNHQDSTYEFYMLENRLRCFSLEKLPLFIFVLKLLGRLLHFVISLWGFAFSWVNVSFCLNVLTVYCCQGIPCLFVLLLVCHSICSLTQISCKFAHGKSCNLIWFTKLHTQLWEIFPFHWSTFLVAQ